MVFRDCGDKITAAFALTCALSAWNPTERELMKHEAGLTGAVAVT